MVWKICKALPTAPLVPEIAVKFPELSVLAHLQQFALPDVVPDLVQRNSAPCVATSLVAASV